MIIKSIHIKNYKCFYDTGVIAFGPGFNFVLGKNDSGKSTLLEALGFPTLTVPHRSLKLFLTKATSRLYINEKTVGMAGAFNDSRIQRSKLRCRMILKKPFGAQYR